MAGQEASSVLARIEQLGETTRNEAVRLVQHVYEDGAVTRPEAEALFALNARLPEDDVIWGARFIEAISDFLIRREAPVGWVTDEEAGWLIGQISAGGAPTGETQIDLVLAVLRQAEGAPQRLSRFALGAISERIGSAGRAVPEDIERMRKALFAGAGEGSLYVTRHEATILFETNDAIAFARNHPDWNELFARAIANHLIGCAHPDPISETAALAREAWLKDRNHGLTDMLAHLSGRMAQGNWFDRIMYDPKKAARARMATRDAAARAGQDITTDESDWLMSRLGWDKTVSPAERALVDFLRRETPGFAEGLAVTG